jgi:hypothetical protein
VRSALPSPEKGAPGRGALRPPPDDGLVAIGGRLWGGEERSAGASARADEQVQWTCESDERPERKRRAGGAAYSDLILVLLRTSDRTPRIRFFWGIGILLPFSTVFRNSFSRELCGPPHHALDQLPFLISNLTLPAARIRINKS